MEFTDIRVKKIPGDRKLKAYVSVIFDNCFVVHNIKIVEGDNGMFIAMPSWKTRVGEFRDIAHPINAEFRAKMQKKIIEQYNSENAMNDLSAESPG